MAVLLDVDEQLRHVLRSRHLVGRSRAMHTTLAEPEVSAQHAVIAWQGEHWVVRDLGSRNGTTVRGVTVQPGVDVALAAGDEICFGAPRHRFVLSSDAEPAAVATSGARIVEGEGDLLGLPDAEQPEAVVVYDLDDGWVLLVDGRSQAVEDGASVVVGGDVWTLHLPETLEQTCKRGSSWHRVEDVALGFRVSADEEYVEVRVSVGGETHLLKPRAHHYLLLILARARLQDAAAGLPLGEQGWRYRDDVTRMAGISSNSMYVGVHRSRRDLEVLEIDGAEEIIQRRSTTTQLRIGVARLEVASA